MTIEQLVEMLSQAIELSAKEHDEFMKAIDSVNYEIARPNVPILDKHGNAVGSRKAQPHETLLLK